MATNRWSDLSTKAKAGVIVVAAVDAGLRSWALRDLAGRSKDQVKGPKWVWAGGIAVFGTAGVVPAIYLAWGRKAPAQMT